MVKNPRNMVEAVRQKLIAQLMEEAHPIPAGWEGTPEEAVSLKAIDRMMAFRSHPLFHEIRAALERMEDGTYGQCTLCRDAIPKESLINLPTVRFCHRCGERLQNRNRTMRYFPAGNRGVGP